MQVTVNEKDLTVVLKGDEYLAIFTCLTLFDPVELLARMEESGHPLEASAHEVASMHAVVLLLLSGMKDHLRTAQTIHKNTLNPLTIRKSTTSNAQQNTMTVDQFLDMIMGRKPEADNSQQVTINLTMKKVALISLALSSFTGNTITKTMQQGLPFEVCEHVLTDSRNALRKFNNTFHAMIDAAEVDIDEEIYTDIKNTVVDERFGPPVAGKPLPAGTAESFAKMVTLAHL